MMLHEFQERIEKLGCSTNVAHEDYAVIEEVYTWHPAVHDKDHIATLFMVGGIGLIKDMLPAARAMMEMESDEQIVLAEIEALEQKRNDLRERMKLTRLRYQPKLNQNNK